MYSSTPNSVDSSDDSRRNRLNQSDCTGNNSKFRFSPRTRLFHSADSSCNSSQSERSNSPQIYKKTKRKNKKKLPPIGIFWDIENCQVPKNKSASAVVQRVREFFLKDHREAEFLVVCDVKKERSQIIQELHDSQVNVIHVASTSKNAADEKLRQSLRRFAEVYRPPCCVVLISGDINFAGDLSDLRYRKKIKVVLVHNTNVADALILCASEHHKYTTITEGLPSEKPKGQSNEGALVLVSNLPKNLGASTIKNRLSFLTDNCGGKVIEVLHEDGCAVIKFCNQDFANRAQKRIQGEDVFGNKIKATTPTLRSFNGKKVKAVDVSYQSTPGIYTPRGFAPEHLDVSGTSSLMDLNLGAIPKRFRTPVESNRVHRTSGSSELSDDGQKSNDKPVDLIVSNLDPTIGNLNVFLTNIIKEYAMILSMKVYNQREGYPVAAIRVNNQKAAQFVISQLHRKKIGHKRILISYAQNNQLASDQLKSMVISILQEVPDNTIPLFKLLKLLEARFHCTVSLNEVNKLKDVCKIIDKYGSRMISLATEYKASPPPVLNQVLWPYCTIHCSHGLTTLGWGELGTQQTLNVMISLETFTNQLRSLLDLHTGCMHLLSFQSCYEKEFCEVLPVDANGVPLEHLISCVRNVRIKLTGPNSNIKVIKTEITASEVEEEDVLRSAPLQLAHNISLFSREVVDLLKTTDKCQLPLSKFIPAYHHHFGRQCHVADYGYTKLLDLLESIPHVAQIMGDGSRKVLTLSHHSQMRRFTSDLLRVLKVQPFKQIKLDEFASAYEKVITKSFNPVHYGLCTFADLLKESADNVVVITQNDDGEVVISIPKREQTSKEIAKTKQFAMEVIDILRHSQNYTMLFNQFVPAYHHNFGHQCRVSDYGFSKLVELFEAIPDVVKIQQMPDGERTVSLTLPQSLKILGGQLKALSESNSVYLENLPQLYLDEYGHQLRPQVYECEDFKDLVGKLRDYVEIVDVPCSRLHMVFPVDYVTKLKIRAWSLLLDHPHAKNANVFKEELEQKCSPDLFDGDFDHLRDVITLSKLNDTTELVSLTDLYKMAAELYHLLYANGGCVRFGDLKNLYRRRYWKNLDLLSYDVLTVDDLYRKLDFLFFVSMYEKDVLTLNRNLIEFEVALPSSIASSDGNKAAQAPLRVMQLKRDSFTNRSTDNSSLSRSIWSVDSPPDPKSSVRNLNIRLPIDVNPKFMGNPFDLISPARTLFPHNMWSMSPEATELPIPDKLIIDLKNCEDSGVKLETSSELSSSLRGSSDGNSKRQFRSFMSFD